MIMNEDEGLSSTFCYKVKDALTGKKLPMYLRFVTTRIDEDSHKPQGVFVAAYALMDSGELPPDERKRVREILDWFKENLPTPPKRRSKLVGLFFGSDQVQRKAFAISGS